MNMDVNAIFEIIWEKCIVPLEGQDVLLISGKINKILSVTNEGVKRITSKGNPRNIIPKDRFNYAVGKLLKDGLLAREDLEPSKNRDSSGIFAILLCVPFIELKEKELTLNAEVIQQKLGLRHCEEA